MKFLAVFGTRPEAIKMAPVLRALALKRGATVRVCVTAQHREMLDQVLSFFKICPDYDLNVMKAGQDLNDIAALVLSRLKAVFKDFRPDWVLVQGDTTTAFAAALAAAHEKIPLAHIEAGLRSGDIASPWPEELNRRLIARIAEIHFAPTPIASKNLIKEGVRPRQVLITGNTGIDALLAVVSQIKKDPQLQRKLDKKWAWIDPRKKLILMTGHRRENLGAGLQRVFMALAQIAKRNDVQIICPVHPNPKVQSPAKKILKSLPRVHLTPPLDYPDFVYLMSRAHLILTDSGGVQEEAPALGKPVLVTRETTERPEGLSAKTAILVGTNTGKILTQAHKLLDDPKTYRQMSRVHNPYGNGKAAEKIAAALIC